MCIRDSFQDDGALFARLHALAAILQEMWDRVRQVLKGEGIAAGKSKAACLNASPRFNDPSAAGYVNPFLLLPAWISKGEITGKDPGAWIEYMTLRATGAGGGGRGLRGPRPSERPSIHGMRERDLAISGPGVCTLHGPETGGGVCTG